MRIVRYQTPTSTEPRWGAVTGEQVLPLAGSPFSGAAPAGGEAMPLAEARLLAPVTPRKVVGVGRNYRAHAAEHDADVPTSPLIFLKPPTSVVGPGAPILLPPQSSRVEHEGELAVVVGAAGRWIDEAEAARHVLGYTAANDVTARDLQRADPQWTRGKGFDSFTPLGPWIETELELSRVEVTCAVNGEPRQRGSAAQMVFSVAQLVAYISTVMTLEPGDVILTGTPAGVSPLSGGDEVTVEVSGIGRLSNPVRVDPRGDRRG